MGHCRACSNKMDKGSTCSSCGWPQESLLVLLKNEYGEVLGERQVFGLERAKTRAERTRKQYPGLTVEIVRE